MKKTITTVLVSAMVISLAQGATLVQSWDDFSTLSQGDALLNGSSVNTDGILHVNMQNGTYTNRPTIDISSARLSLTDGLTIAFTAKGFDISNNVAIISMAATGNDYHAAVGSDSSGNANFYFNGSDGKVTDIGTQGSLGSGSNYTFFTFTSQLVDNQCVFTLYKDGEKLAQGYASDTDPTVNTNQLAASELSRITLGGWSGNSNNSKTSFDLSDLAIYNGAMSAAEVKSLYAASIPEPTTATLSLLALAGLAARRRRK